jgi:hypothetical protein
MRPSLSRVCGIERDCSRVCGNEPNLPRVCDMERDCFRLYGANLTLAICGVASVAFPVCVVWGVTLAICGVTSVTVPVCMIGALPFRLCGASLAFLSVWWRA